MRVTLSDIRTAAAKLDGIVAHTPTVRSQTLSAILGAEVYLKLENLQYTASFKERGAYIRLAGLSTAERRRGVIAMSAGNHAQGVAYNARRLGIPATIVMPATTPMTKVENTRVHGAEVVLAGDTLAEAMATARTLEAQRDLVFVHPFDDADIIAGQGTVALEMLVDVPDLDVLVVPVGGGGLISGMGIAAKALKSDIEVVGVESEMYPSLYQGLRGGSCHGSGVSIAEGIAVKEPGALTLELARAVVDAVLLVSETAIERAIQMLIEIEKTVVEGAGAAALAALLTHRERFSGRKVGLVASGGNIDSRLLAQVLMRGMAREGRLARLRIELPDLPGNLAKVTALLGAAEANILEVAHQRFFYDIPAKQTDVDIVIETRGPDHVRDVLDRLSAAGFAARQLSNTSREGAAG